MPGESSLPPDLIKTLEMESEALWLRMKYLVDAGFTRQEAMAIILAAVPNAPKMDYMFQGKA